MFIQDNLRELKAPTGDWVRDSKFLFMFMGVVVAPFLAFAIDGRNPNDLGQFSLARSLMAVALLLLISVSSGALLYRRRPRAAAGLSILAK
jgi:hypothetical protein